MLFEKHILNMSRPWS